MLADDCDWVEDVTVERTLLKLAKSVGSYSIGTPSQDIKAIVLPSVKEAKDELASVSVTLYMTLPGMAVTAH
jgi:hypothetical protein